MRILLCGFEPFGQRSVNNAWEVVRQFTGRDDVDVIQVPVSFSRAHATLLRALERQHYDAVVMVGETSFTKNAVRLERVAINYMDSAKPDNDGVTADDEPLIPGAPKAYFTTFPVKRVAGALLEQSHKVKVTNSTGTFVCNSIYYNILHHIETNGLQLTPLFVHLPASTEEVTLDEMRDTVAAILAKAKTIKGIDAAKSNSRWSSSSTDEDDDSSSSSSSSSSGSSSLNDSELRQFISDGKSGDIDKMISALEWLYKTEAGLKPKVRALDEEAIKCAVELDKASQEIGKKYDTFTLAGALDSKTDEMSSSQLSRYNKVCGKVVVYFTSSENTSEYNSIYRRLRYGL